MSSTNGQARKRTFASPKEAREQAAEAQGFLASVEIKVGDEIYEVPQRGLLDDDQAERFFALELEVESWDREPDVVLKQADGSTTTRPGPLKRPYRKNGTLVKPQYAVQVAVALWGKERYEKYKAGGGRAADVTAALAMLDKRVEEREQIDPFRVDGAAASAAVPQADRS